MKPELINFDMAQNQSSIIKVIGVGGGGSNAVNHMYNHGIQDVTFVVCNTDAQALANSPVPFKIRLGETLTEGRGAGNRPEIGKQAAIESVKEISRVLEDNTKMIFITAGMGGGTGTGAAPIIAKMAKELNILTVGIVTIPFRFEGPVRISQAIDGIDEIEKHVDSLLIINNEKLREMYGDLKISSAFAKADDVLATAAKGIAEIITVHGHINVDFADVETVMKNSGVAIMGSGTGTGENRTIDAISMALESPLLNNSNLSGAKNILLNISSGVDEVTMDEVSRITDYVGKMVGSEATIIWGTGINQSLTDEVTVTIIATGFDYNHMMDLTAPPPVDRKMTRIETDYEGVVSKVIELDRDNVGDNSFDDDAPARVVSFNDLEMDKEARINRLYGYKSQDGKGANNESKSKIEFQGDMTPKVSVRKAGGMLVSIDPDDLTDERRIEDLENIPAYQRRRALQKGDEPNKMEQRISRFSITDNGHGKSKLSQGNKFLHDNVD